MFRRNVLGALALVAVAGILGAACGGGAATTAGPAARFAPEHGAGDVAGQPAALPTTAPVAGEFQLTVLGPRVIKTATVSIEIKDHTFEQRAQDITLIASRHGGFVASSRTTGDKLLTATIVLRIPASQFEVALGELKALGKVKSEQISGEDVTAQFVDLQARLRNWEAQEAVLLRLMAKSATIDESLKVQRALQDVQLAIEEIRGQLHVLSDQTDMSTITLSVSEKAPAKAAKKANAFVRSLRASLHGTVAVLTAIVVGLGYLAPIVALTLAVGLGWLVYRRSRSRPKAVPTA